MMDLVNRWRAFRYFRRKYPLCRSQDLWRMAGRAVNPRGL
jgi:hypothetical protein